MSRELSYMDACHICSLSKFFFVEYAKRHAILTAQSAYSTACNSFNVLKYYFDSNCDGCVLVNECLTKCIKTHRYSMTLNEDLTFHCLANKALGIEDKINPCKIHSDFFLDSPKRKQKFESYPLSMLLIHLKNSNDIIRKYNTNDFDYLQSVDIIHLICGVKQIPSFSANFKRPMNSKYAYIFEQENGTSSCKTKGLHIVNLFPEYEEPEADITWITSNKDLILRNICISKNHLKSKTSLVLELLNSLILEIKKIKCKKMVEGLRGDSIIKRLVGLLVWDKVNTDGKKIEFSCVEIKALLQHNDINDYNEEYLRKIYYQADNSIKKWSEYYGNMRGEAKNINHLNLHTNDTKQPFNEDACQEELLNYIIDNLNLL